ncbi:MAG: transcriptional regulator [Candidatus Methanolliviera hydrocarbonicum]|uniref:Transcriptional regulator n=1 Tax=Candidatus Methanolliviera hydrocarbonicum TaxID=2491085 RepID=A0A520L0Q7_9EURY|nr:MAG: transcriptional regulator [Candidatus Methanolliviera hydrocarbonicum]
MKEDRVIETILEKMDRMLELEEETLRIISREGEKRELKPLDALTLLDLPDHLRKTAMVMNKLKEATAKEVADETERERSIESAYLNQLHREDYLLKRREGRKVIFYFPEE